MEKSKLTEKIENGKQVGISGTMEAIDYYYLGLESLEKSDYIAAIDFFELSNRIDEHYKTYERLFFCWKNLDEPSKACECLKKSYSLNPKCDKISVEYAHELAERMDFISAQKILSETIKRNPAYKPAEKLLNTIIKVQSDKKE